MGAAPCISASTTAGDVGLEEGAEVALTVHAAVFDAGVLSSSDVLLEIFHDTT